MLTLPLAVRIFRPEATGKRKVPIIDGDIAKILNLVGDKSVQIAIISSHFNTISLKITTGAELRAWMDGKPRCDEIILAGIPTVKRIESSAGLTQAEMLTFIEQKVHLIESNNINRKYQEALFQWLIDECPSSLLDKSPFYTEEWSKRWQRVAAQKKNGIVYD
jgi:hypothetical protein